MYMEKKELSENILWLYWMTAHAHLKVHYVHDTVIRVQYIFCSWLNWFGYNVTAAEEALRNYYMALYLDVSFMFIYKSWILLFVTIEAP